MVRLDQLVISCRVIDFSRFNQFFAILERSGKFNQFVDIIMIIDPSILF